MIARLIVDLLLMGVSFCWGLKNGMEYMEKNIGRKIMRIIDADAFKESLKIGLKEFLPRYKKDQTRILAVEITRGLMKDIDEAETVASCKTCVWRADHVLKVSGREKSLCPIEQHYVLPEDGFCHLYESDKKISDERIKGLAEGKE